MRDVLEPGVLNPLLQLWARLWLKAKEMQRGDDLFGPNIWRAARDEGVVHGIEAHVEVLELDPAAGG
jgi:hypothetical protein